MAEPTGVEILQNEIEKSKDRLKGFNENIKKLTGHENPGPPRARRIFGSERQEYDDNFSGRMGRGRGRLFGLAKRGLMEDSGPPVKRRVLGGAFSRLGPAPQRRVREESPEEEELPTKLSVHSSVVSTSREAKNRQEVMQEQNNDKEGMQRNRRMFGLLLGTLNKFKTDSKTLESKAEQRKRIDQKLEENAEKERKKFKQETMQLMEERHLEQSRISRLEQKMEVVQEHADIEKEMQKLKNFLCTKARPRIFWLPRQMNTTAQNKLKDSLKVVDDMLKSSQDRLEKEIKEVMERENKREERIKMRLREDGLFLEDDAKEKENDEIKKEIGNVNELGMDNEMEEPRIWERPSSGPGEKGVGKKQKVKRRIVVEEHTSRSSDGEIGNEDEGDKNEEERNTKPTKGNVEDPHKSKTLIVKNSDDDSESEEDAEVEKNSETGSLIKKNSQIDGNKKDEGDDEGKDDDDDDDENSRVVLYRENSKDRSRPDKQDNKSKGDDDVDKDGKTEHNRSHSDKHKHSHRRSKHSRRDSERSVKEEREEKGEKKKRKSAERVVQDKEADVKKDRSSSSHKKELMNNEGGDDTDSDNSD